ARRRTFSQTGHRSAIAGYIHDWRGLWGVRLGVGHTCGEGPPRTENPTPALRVKIIGKYVLKEHVGPFVFASTALTSFMLLQYVAKKFGELVGKGLETRVIVEFMALSVPFTVEMTLPMAVLVSVLYSFSRLAAENEITAMK